MGFFSNRCAVADLGRGERMLPELRLESDSHPNHLSIRLIIGIHQI